MKYQDKLNKVTVDYVGETVQSTIADDYEAEHIGITHYNNGNTEVAFKHQGNWITNNALGNLVIFKVKNKFYFLPKKKFEDQFEKIEHSD